MQIHGDVLLNRDVEALVMVGPLDSDIVRIAMEFGTKFGVAVIIMV